PGGWSDRPRTEYRVTHGVDRSPRRPMSEPTSSQMEAFQRDGFLVVERDYLEPTALRELQDRFERLYDGEYETGIQPDEVKWVPGRDSETMTRQVCNIWKPPAAPPLPMHRDGWRLGYVIPSESVTCWLALDAVSRETGAITYARGSHRWAPARAAADVSDGWLAPAEHELPGGASLVLVPAAVDAGGAVFHRFDTFHGYGANEVDVTTR